jgi:fimbrial chaperone protein
MATTLSVTNASDTDTAFQLRVFAWSQSGNDDQLSATDQILASPPIGSIAAGASQVVRIILRRPSQNAEATFRILFDQIPPPAKPGTVRIALRLSIPIFVEPSTRAVPHLQWRVEREGGDAYLVARNSGDGHERVRNIALAAPTGRVFKVDDNQSPYILAGNTRRWRLVTSGSTVPGAVVHLTAQGDSSVIDEPVPISP